MHFMEPNGIETGEEVELIVNLLMHEEPFEQAKVRYEIWSDDEEEHLWVETEEKGAGEYTGVHEFSNKGVYHIQIHVEDDKDRKSTRLNSSHVAISYAVFCLKKKRMNQI